MGKAEQPLHSAGSSQFRQDVSCCVTATSPGHLEKSTPQSLQSTHHLAMNLALVAIHRELPPGKPAGPGPSSHCLCTEPWSRGKAGSLVGMGRTGLGALRLAPANTFRKYGFLVNRVKKENSLTNLPRVKVSPGECAPCCQDWLCHGKCSGCIFPHPLLTSHLMQGAFETSLSQIALGKIIIIITTKQ